MIDAVYFRMPCATLSALVLNAWSLKQIEGGPAWRDSLDSRWGVEAKASAATSPAEMRLMVQSLLAERFQLKIHVETPLRPVFALTVKDRSKLHEVELGEGLRGRVLFAMAGKAKVLIGEKAHISDLLPWITSIVPERPIIDETGLTGAYEFRLQWTPDADQESAEFFSAIQDQLGLKVEDRKAPVEVLVIDRAEKPSPDQ